MSSTNSVTEELHELLAGPHAVTRATVLAGLEPYASVLEEAETLGLDDFRDRVRDVVVELAGSGLTGLGFPKEYGGGADLGASIAAFETLAHGDLSVLVKVGVQFGLFGGAILQLGTERHHDRYLSDVVAGRVLGCFAMTEHRHGSNVAALETVAVYDRDAEEFVITTTREDAFKDYIGNAARHAELAVVFAQLEIDGQSQGVHAFVARIRSEGRVVDGVRIADDGRKMGLNGVDNGRIWFDGLRVPREGLLNRFADVSADGVYSSGIDSVNRRFFTMLGTLIQGRVSVGGAALTASKVALTVATRYALQRRQFDSETKDDTASAEGETLLLDYGQHQRRLLPLIARSYALTFAQEVLVDQLHRSFGGEIPEGEAEVFRRELESRAAGTKAIATWHATRAIQECREACGGAGYLAANRFAALKADTDVFTTFEGDNTVLLQLVAKGLLTDYSSEFSSMDQLDLVRFVAGQAVETVVERANVHKLRERIRDLLPGGGDGSDADSDIRDPEYHLEMLTFREEHMLAGVARRLKGGIDRGTPAGVVFSHVQDHVIALGRAHVERIVHEAFVARLASLEDGPVRTLLAKVADLAALSSIEADRAWWMEHGRLTVQRSKAITAEINSLCRELRPEARTLVDAFGVPEAFLRADDLLAE